MKESRRCVPCPSCDGFMYREATVCRKCWKESPPKGSDHVNWKGGRHPTTHKYISRHAPDHPHASKKGYVPEHHLVMEEHLGGYLLPHETVHHKNNQRDDNRLENLELWSGSQPSGARVEDMVVWAKEILAQYCPIR